MPLILKNFFLLSPAPSQSIFILAKRSCTMRPALSVAIVLAFILLAGCSYKNPLAKPLPTPAPDSGFLVLDVTDAPVAGLRQLNVTLSEFSAFSGGKWLQFSKESKTLDLMMLANKTMPLGRFTLAPGSYEKLSFKITSVSALFSETPKECYRLPFNQAPSTNCKPVFKKHSVKAPRGAVEVYHPFSILPGAETRLILDLDVESLRSYLGKYSFSPSARLLSPEEFAARFFNPQCGDGYCQKVSCTGRDCPAVETPENCPQDCAASTVVPQEECVAHDGVCCLASNQSKCSEALLLCEDGKPAVFKGCEFKEGVCFSLSECG